MNKPSNSTGLIKREFTPHRIEIYEAYLKNERIRNFKTYDELNKLVDIIGKWRFYIGIKEDLSQEEIFMNINFIRENFDELNLVDLHQAINLSLKGELDVDVEHYQNFTPLYISKILKAYKEYKIKIISEIRERQKLENLQKEPTLNEKIEIAKSSLLTLYNQRNDKKFRDYGGVTYDFIKRNELIVFSKTLVAEAMKFGQQETNKNLTKSAFTDALMNTTKNLTTAKEKKEFEIKTYARNYVVQKWLNSFNDKSFDKFLDKFDAKMI